MLLQNLSDDGQKRPKHIVDDN